MNKTKRWVDKHAGEAREKAEKERGNSKTKEAKNKENKEQNDSDEEKEQKTLSDFDSDNDDTDTMTGETSESDADFITVTTDNEAGSDTSGMEYEDNETELESGGRGTKGLANESPSSETREKNQKEKLSKLQNIMTKKLNMDRLSITSQNFQRIRPDHFRIANELTKTDILITQEITWPDDKNDDLRIKLEKQYKCKTFKCNGLNGSHLVTFVKDTLENNIKGFNIIIEGRATRLHIANKEYSYNIINTYGPPSNTDEYIHFATKHFGKIKRIENAILIGDWNLLLKGDICNKERNRNHKCKTKLIGHYFDNWIDIHNIIPTQLQYTYTRGQYRARHDRIYMKSYTTQK